MRVGYSLFCYYAPLALIRKGGFLFIDKRHISAILIYMIPIMNNGYRRRINSPPSPSSIKFIQGHMDDSFKDLMRTYELKDLYWIDDEPNNIRAIGVLTHPKGGSKDNLILLFPPY